MCLTKTISTIDRSRGPFQSPLPRKLNVMPKPKTKPKNNHDDTDHIKQRVVKLIFAYLGMKMYFEKDANLKSVYMIILLILLWSHRSMVTGQGK